MQITFLKKIVCHINEDVGFLGIMKFNILK